MFSGLTVGSAGLGLVWPLCRIFRKQSGPDISDPAYPHPPRTLAARSTLGRIGGKGAEGKGGGQM